jgi:hypothetical protein
MDYNDSIISDCSYADLYAVIERRAAPKPSKCGVIVPKPSNNIRAGIVSEFSYADLYAVSERRVAPKPDYNKRASIISDCSYADLYAVSERRVAPKPTRSFSIEGIENDEKEEKRTRPTMRKAGQDKKEQWSVQGVKLPSVEKSKTKSKSSDESRDCPKTVQRASSLPGPNESRPHHSRHTSSTRTSPTHSPKRQGSPPMREHHTVNARRPVTNESHRKTLPSSQHTSDEKGLSPRSHTKTLLHPSTNTKSPKKNRICGTSKPSEDVATKLEHLERQMKSLRSETHGKLHDSKSSEELAARFKRLERQRNSIRSETHGKLHDSKPSKDVVARPERTMRARNPVRNEIHRKTVPSSQQQISNERGLSPKPHTRTLVHAPTTTKSSKESRSHGTSKPSEDFPARREHVERQIK